MSRPATSYGQFHVAEPLHNLTLVHRHDGTPLMEVSHEPALPVLEQENFGTQGIDTSQLVPGAPKVDALGNCVYNAGTTAVANLGRPAYLRYLEMISIVPSDSADAIDQAVVGEKAAIVAYHQGTLQTGTPSQEWPPTDCGSSGVYLTEFLSRIGVISTQRIAHGAQDIVSLLQADGIALGGPWFNAWEDPGPLGMVDGNGTSLDLERAIRSGVAGGHERYSWSVETLVLSATGLVIPEKTILVDRNSWGASWGDHGNYRVHLSTYVALLGYMDFRQLVA